VDKGKHVDAKLVRSGIVQIIYRQNAVNPDLNVIVDGEIDEGGRGSAFDKKS
jgi:hypothetical protein